MAPDLIASFFAYASFSYDIAFSSFTFYLVKSSICLIIFSFWPNWILNSSMIFFLWRYFSWICYWSCCSLRISFLLCSMISELIALRLLSCYYLNLSIFSLFFTSSACFFLIFSLSYIIISSEFKLMNYNYFSSSYFSAAINSFCIRCIVLDAPPKDCLYSYFYFPIFYVLSTLTLCLVPIFFYAYLSFRLFYSFLAKAVNGDS